MNSQSGNATNYPNEMIQVLRDNIIKNASRLAFYKIKGFTQEALKDEYWVIRLRAYRLFGFTKDAFKDKKCWIRLEAYRKLGFTEEALEDEDEQIRLEAKKYFKAKALINNLN